MIPEPTEQRETWLDNLKAGDIAELHTEGQPEAERIRITGKSEKAWTYTHLASDAQGEIPLSGAISEGKAKRWIVPMTIPERKRRD